MTSPGGGYVLVVSVQPLDAMTTLFFGHLRHLEPGSIRIVQHGRDDLFTSLAAASAVVFVRALFEFDDVARCARALRIPLYYFLDDNFIVLREHGGIEAAFVSRYSVEQVRTALRGFAGVLLATPPLVEYFTDHRLHPRLLLYPPIAGHDALPAPARRPAFHVAFFGGRHLHAMLRDTVVPAIRRLARERPVTLVAAGVTEGIQPSAGLSVIAQPYDESYSRGLSRLAAEGIDALVHPQASGMANNAYKNPHALISAHALGAVPVVSNAPPYDDLRPAGIALLCDDTEDSWYRALAQIANDADGRSEIHGRLAKYCADTFDGARNRDVVNMMQRDHGPAGRGPALFRSGIARAYLLMSLAGRVASRVKKSIRLASMVAAV